MFYMKTSNTLVLTRNYLGLWLVTGMYCSSLKCYWCYLQEIHFSYPCYCKSAVCWFLSCHSWHIGLNCSRSWVRALRSLLSTKMQRRYRSWLPILCFITSIKAQLYKQKSNQAFHNYSSYESSKLWWSEIIHAKVQNISSSSSGGFSLRAFHGHYSDVSGRRWK